MWPFADLSKRVLGKSRHFIGAWFTFEYNSKGYLCCYTAEHTFVFLEFEHSQGSARAAAFQFSQLRPVLVTGKDVGNVLNDLDYRGVKGPFVLPQSGQHCKTIKKFLPGYLSGMGKEQLLPAENESVNERLTKQISDIKDLAEGIVTVISVYQSQQREVIGAAPQPPQVIEVAKSPVRPEEVGERPEEVVESPEVEPSELLQTQKDLNTKVKLLKSASKEYRDRHDETGKKKQFLRAPRCRGSDIYVPGYKCALCNSRLKVFEEQLTCRSCFQLYCKLCKRDHRLECLHKPRKEQLLSKQASRNSLSSNFAEFERED